VQYYRARRPRFPCHRLMILGTMCTQNRAKSSRNALGIILGRTLVLVSLATVTGRLLTHVAFAGDARGKYAARAEDDLTVSTQQYPSRPIRLIEPFGLGGGPDILGRALATQLTELWHQSVTVENVTGDGATAGPALVAKSRPDGYTLLINTSAQAYSAAVVQLTCPPSE
jgi:tripartite-type tricarboxylate transporter receptor subunit TctC